MVPLPGPRSAFTLLIAGALVTAAGWVLIGPQGPDGAGDLAARPETACTGCDARHSTLANRRAAMQKLRELE